MLVAVCIVYCQVPLPDRRLRMIFSAEHKTDLPAFVHLLKEHPGTINIASAYCYTLGIVSPNTTLLPDNFCWDYFTKPVQALQPKIHIHPIIQMGGDNAIANFGRAEIFVKLFVPEALKYNYSGYFMDVEFHGDKHYHEAERYHEFLHVFGSALHEHNISLTVLSRSDNSHATPISIINVTGGVDAFVVEESSRNWKEVVVHVCCSTYLCVCLFVTVYICVYIGLCLLVCLSICLSVCQSICLSLCICLFVSLSVSVSVNLSVSASICLSLCISVCPSVCVC